MLHSVYMKKIRGCFTGKAVGGTLGMPLEGFIGTKKIAYYDPVPTEMVANDDLDLQVIWLEAIKRFGLPINRKILGDAFAQHILCVWDEYYSAVRNVKMGLYPPLSGSYDNKFINGMGAAIRTEIWACLAPGDPALAAKLAKEDACVDHYADGVDAAMFIAALESAAFVESDPQKLVDIGLAYVDPNGRLFAMVAALRQWLAEGLDLLSIRERLLTRFFSQNWTDVTTNVSFIILGLLTYGGDISKGLCDVVGLGHDADCTGATFGSICGIINPDGFEERWTKPLGNDLVLTASIGSIHEPTTISEFCQHIADICPDVLKFYGSAVSLTDVPEDRNQAHCVAPWALSDKNLSLSDTYCQNESVVSVSPITIKLHYPDKVALAPGEMGKFTAFLSNPKEAAIDCQILLAVPNGWRVMPQEFSVDIPEAGEAEITFSVTAPEVVNRCRANNPLDFHCSVNGLSYVVTAGLVQTVDFLCTETDSDAEKCPVAEVLSNGERLSAYRHFFPLEEKKQVFCAEFRSPVLVSEAILVVQGTRRMRVWIDDELILSHDGCEYIPAFHRTDYSNKLSLDCEWHKLTIWTDDTNYDGTRPGENPGNAIAFVEGSMKMREYRERYDATIGESNDGELFFGFAQRSGNQWLRDMEWRLPCKV